MVGTDIRQNVPIARKRRSFEVSSGKARPESNVKNRALRPNAARGNAVAVPRCAGQFNAATLMAAWKAVQLPQPVRNDRKQTVGTLMEPAPSSYAFLIGKYPAPNRIAPRTAPGRGPLVSTRWPKGMPEAYMPTFPAAPMRLLSVADSFSRSASCGPHAEYAYCKNVNHVLQHFKTKGSDIGAAC